MNIIVKPVSEMSKTEYNACYAANFGGRGYMRETLEECWDNDEGHVVMLWEDGVKYQRGLVGWVLLTPCTTEGELAVSRYAARRSKYLAMFFVKPEHRRNGHSKTLMEEVLKLDPRPHVMPHNNQSASFFAKYPVTISAVDLCYMRGHKRVPATV